MATRNTLRAHLAHGSDDLALAVEADPSGTNAPLALVAFFLDWIVVGLALAQLLVRRVTTPQS